MVATPSTPGQKKKKKKKKNNHGNVGNEPAVNCRCSTCLWSRRLNAVYFFDSDYRRNGSTAPAGEEESSRNCEPVPPDPIPPRPPTYDRGGRAPAAFLPATIPAARDSSCARMYFLSAGTHDAGADRALQGLGRPDSPTKGCLDRIRSTRLTGGAGGFKTMTFFVRCGAPGREKPRPVAARPRKALLGQPSRQGTLDQSTAKRFDWEKMRTTPRVPGCFMGFEQTSTRRQAAADPVRRPATEPALEHCLPTGFRNGDGDSAGRPWWKLGVSPSPAGQTCAVENAPL